MGICPLRLEPPQTQIPESSRSVVPARRRLDPPIAPGTRIHVVLRNDSNAAAYAFSQWVQAGGPYPLEVLRPEKMP